MDLKLFMLTVYCFNSLANGNILINYVSPGNCSDNEFYDITQLKCQSCATIDSASPESAIQAQLQVRSADGFSCVCKAGSFFDFSKTIETAHCIKCPNGQATSLNQVGCSTCAVDISFSNGTQSCSPCDNGLYVERSTGSGTEIFCMPCPSGTVLSQSGKSCVSCHPSFLKVSRNCTCPSRVFDGICIPKNFLLKETQSLYLVEYDSLGLRLRSQYFSKHLQAAVFNCKQHNKTACQILANLCVLLHYNFNEDKFSETNACIELRQQLYSSRGVSINWRDIPMIYYGTDAMNELERTTLTKKFKINETLKIVAARYSISGNLLKFSELQDSELQLCKENSRKASSGYLVGTNYKQKCHLPIKDLWYSNTANVFYDLYIKIDQMLYPIPVLNRNLKKDNYLINQLDYENRKWQLTRRFYLIDSISGIESKSTTSQEKPNINTKAKVLRYARSINIRVKLQEEGDSGTIYPPLIIINYEDIPEDKLLENLEVEAEFSITYLMSQWKTQQDLSITIGVLCGLAVLWSVFKTWSLAKRADKQAIDAFIVGKFFIVCCGNISNVFFLVNIFAAIVWFITFKNQSVLNLIIPTQEQEKILIIYITIAAFLKLIQIIYELIIIGTIDIFFIDWERQKTKDIISNFAIKTKPSLNLNEEQNEGSSFISTRSSVIGTPTISKETEFPNVTIWRSYFIANEWMELCACRKLNMPLHIMIVIFLLDYIGLANLASASTKNMLVIDDSQANVPISLTCRIAVGTLVYYGVAVTYIILVKYIYQKFICDKLSEFVDLCSVSNISIFIMTSKRFGYYIHGRSANGRADVNMKEMHELLKREEDDLCSKRGLLPNSHQQTFEMALPSSVNDHYHKLRMLLTGFSQATDRMKGINGISKVEVEKVISTYLSINKFLSGFIEHTFKDVDYTVVDKSTLESIFAVELNEIRDKGYFYNDNGHSFDAVLFFGFEMTLICFELMIFLVFDISFQSFTFAGVAVFVITEIFKYSYLVIAKKNLARKALIDERFLI